VNGEGYEPDNRHSLPVTEQNPERRHTRPEGVSDIRALTGLRGVAAMMVVAYHFWPRTDIPTNWLKWTVGRGYLWVDLFFVLSGFVIYYNYSNSILSAAGIYNFFVARFARGSGKYIRKISRRTSMPSQNRLAKPAMLFSKSTAEQSQSNCKKEFSLERIRLLRRSAGGSQ